MLVFTRKRNETIMIGDGIEVRVLRIGRDGVRLGVTAPPNVPVHRREVYDLIREENRRAAEAAPSVARLRDRFRATDGPHDTPSGSDDLPAAAQGGRRVKDPHAT